MSRVSRAGRATRSKRSCDEVSDELRALLVEKRHELGRRIEELRFLDQRMAHLAGQLTTSDTPRTLIKPWKEAEHAPTL